MSEPTPLGDLFARFQTVAFARPEAPALFSERESVSFDQLHRKAGAVAAGLAAKGVLPGDRIAIHISRSVEAVAAVLGVGLAGAVGVPLDPSYPITRRAFVLKDSRPKYVLASLKADHPDRTAELTPWPVLWLEDLETESGRFPQAVQRPAQSPMYVMYTSGSTGAPKGVIGSMGAAANRIEWMWNAFPFGPSEVLAARTSLAFVDSVWELYGALLAGIPTLIVPSRDSSDPRRLLARLREGCATRITVVPSLLALLLEAEPQLGSALPILGLWTSSGEALPRNTAVRFQAAAPNATLLNLYGTTEIAGDATFAIVASPTQQVPERVPLGRPIRNAHCYVLGPDGKRCRVGEEGELYVGGQVVASGYYNRAEETAARFLPDLETQTERMYRTGDRVFEGPDGMLYYVGRNDRQVQIRGSRVELEEVENALMGLNAGVQEAVVVAVGHPGELGLVAYISPAVANPEQLAMMLRLVLPEFACPGKFIVMDELPHLPNGKLDRNALRQPPPARRPASLTTGDPPITDFERLIATIWSEVLGVSPVLRTDRFLLLGGDSMQWIRFLLHLSRRLGREGPDITITMGMSLMEVARRMSASDVDSAAPDDGIVIELLTHADAEQAAALAAESFPRAEPMANALDLPPSDFFLFCRQFVTEGVNEGVSVVARELATGNIVGFCLAHAFDATMPPKAEPAPFGSIVPILALLDELYAEYLKSRGPFEPGEVGEIFMTGCAAGLDALSLAAKMERKVRDLLKAHGYRRVMTVCTHHATVFLSERVHLFDKVTAIRYEQFTHGNHKPFERIAAAHSGAVLFEGKL